MNNFQSIGTLQSHSKSHYRHFYSHLRDYYESPLQVPPPVSRRPYQEELTWPRSKENHWDHSGLDLFRVQHLHVPCDSGPLFRRDPQHLGLRIHPLISVGQSDQPSHNGYHPNGYWAGVVWVQTRGEENRRNHEEIHQGGSHENSGEQSIKETKENIWFE